MLHGVLGKLLPLVAWLAILAVVFGVLERAFTLRSLGGRREGIARDLVYYFLNSLVPAILLGAVGAVLVRLVAHFLPASYTNWIASWPFLARSLAFFVVAEIGFYWGHRLSHINEFLWRFHAVHHSAEHLDWLANTRAHPIDMIFGRLCGLVPAYALGLATPAPNGNGLAPVLLLIFSTVWGFFIHSNVRWRFGPLEWLLATPAFHHWHHTNDHNRDRNFASTLPWLDRLFGTHHLPREWPSEYGIDDKSMPRDVTGQLLKPLRR